MTLSDYLLTSLNNIRKNRLRSLLTIIGVAVAIGALTSMMSLGIGLQENLNENIKKNRIITQLTVTSRNSDTKKSILSDSVINIFSKIDGVEKAFKESRIPAKILYNDTFRTTTIKTIPGSYEKYFPKENYVSGSFFSNDSSHQLIITDNFLEDLLKMADSAYRKSPEKADSIMPSLIGAELIISAITIDTRIMTNMFAAMSAMMSNKLPFRDSLLTFTISGIVKQNNMSDRGTGIYITEKAGKKIPQLNFENIWDLLNDKQMPDIQSVSVYTTGIKEAESVQKAIQKLGYNARSFLDNMKEIKRVFLVMDSVLGALGIMALFIATLGLVNTLIMSIYERTREIGILKSLGARNGQVRKLFVIEAGCVGLGGAIIGIPLGWFVTRLINMVLFSTLLKDVDEKIMLFSFPWYLITSAIVFSVLFSILAGLYPAMRASKIDPVKALRHE